MRKKALFIVAVIGVSAYNIFTLFDYMPANFSHLALGNLVALAEDETSGGSSSGECSQRGGGELPNKVLLLTSCTKEVAIKVGTSIEYKKVSGSQCKCCKKPSGYQGILGCNLSWETSCK